MECIVIGGVASQIPRSRRTFDEAFSCLCLRVSGIHGCIFLRYPWHRDCIGQRQPLLCLRKAMATAREDAITTGIAGRPNFHSESDAIHNMERVVGFHLRSYCCLRRGRVKGTGHGMRHVTYFPNSAPYQRAKILWNATASVVAGLFQFLKEFHSVLVLETAVHEATLNRLCKFGQPDGPDGKVKPSEFYL